MQQDRLSWELFFILTQRVKIQWHIEVVVLPGTQLGVEAISPELLRWVSGGQVPAARSRTQASVWPSLLWNCPVPSRPSNWEFSLPKSVIYKCPFPGPANGVKECLSFFGLWPGRYRQGAQVSRAGTEQAGAGNFPAASFPQLPHCSILSSG